jgi:hypothetical protein
MRTNSIDKFKNSRTILDEIGYNIKIEHENKIKWKTNYSETQRKS